MEKKTKKIKKIKPYSPEYEKMVNELARNFCPPIYPCKHCGYPVVKGYCCENCESNNPF